MHSYSTILPLISGGIGGNIKCCYMSTSGENNRLTNLQSASWRYYYVSMAFILISILLYCLGKKEFNPAAYICFLIGCVQFGYHRVNQKKIDKREQSDERRAFFKELFEMNDGVLAERSAKELIQIIECVITYTEDDALIRKIIERKKSAKESKGELISLINLLKDHYAPQFSQN